MGRPRKKERTINVRAYKSTIDELRLKFPNQDTSDLIDLSYRTSALKLEAALRKPKLKR